MSFLRFKVAMALRVRYSPSKGSRPRTGRIGGPDDGTNKSPPAPPSPLSEKRLESAAEARSSRMLSIFLALSILLAAPFLGHPPPPPSPASVAVAASNGVDDDDDAGAAAAIPDALLEALANVIAS
jgi:hypothetical protein